MPQFRRNVILALCGYLISTASFAQEADLKETPKLKPAGDGRVAVPLAAIGKEYLMSISIIPQYEAATSSGLSGHIVIFELFDDALDMYESSTGLVVTDDLPTRRLVASFPVVKKQKNQVIIDFNAGMRRVFTAGWIGRNRFSADAMADVLEVPQSRVFSVKDEKGQLSIRQAVQARSRQFRQDVEQRMEVRYFIGPYTPGDFKSKSNTPVTSRYVRYFETTATLELTSGRPESHTARFDITKPVTFYYSGNTPEAYVDSIRGGILYWNRAFGKEVVRCEKAPEGVTAPDAQHNVVQWVPWDSAGFAYADILVDPRTGKSMHGQAYMTSVFAISGVQRARLVLRRMRALETKEPEKKDDKKDDEKKDGDKDDEKKRLLTSRMLGLPLFRSTASCECDIEEYAAQFASGLESLLAAADEGEAGNAAMLRASQDYVRNVAAHEVGHVLGLRHNFAGSLAGTVSPKALDEWFAKYLKEEKPPEMKGKLTSASVMEYTHFQSAVFNGCKMRTTDEVLPHDKAAIQWGYFADNTAIDKKLLFGTDDDVGTYGDVNRFDYGAEPIVESISDVGKRINGLPVRLIEQFISAKAPRDPRDATPLDQLNLSASSDVASLISDYRSGLKWFSSSTRSLRIERDFPYIGVLNEEARAAAHWKSLNEQITKAGGIDRFAFGFAPLPLTLDLKPPVADAVPPTKFDAAKMTAKFAELLEKDAYKKFVGADGKEHEFTDKERELIKKRSEAYFKDFEKQLVRRLLQTWATTRRDLGAKVQGHVVDDDIIAKFEKQILAAAKYVIVTRDIKNKDARISGKVDKAYVEVVDFKYDLETRVDAARAIADSAGSYSAWAKDVRVAMGKELKTLVDSSLNINNFKTFTDSKLSRPLRDWYLDQQVLLRSLR